MNSEDRPRQTTWRDLILLCLMAATLFLTNLGAARLWDRDEPRNAGCAAEMLARQDWVTPMFNGEMRGQKPVLLYWMMMAGYQVFGVNEFAARLSSSLLGIGTVLVTYGLGRHLLGRRTGIWAAVILASTLMFAVASRAATPDAPLIFFTTMGIAIFAWLGVPSYESRSKDPRVAVSRFPGWAGATLVYLALAGGVLAKGPIAAILPSCIIGLFLMVQSTQNQGRYRWIPLLDPRVFLRSFWQMKPWILVACVLLVAGPWFVWAGIRTEGDFLRWFFLEEHFGRATTAMENHSGGPWYYPVAILVGFFPWSILAIPVVMGLVVHMRGDSNESRRDQAGLQLALIWVTLQVLVFTLVRTKLPSYVTPCYPGLALLVGHRVAAMSEGRLFCNARWLYGGYATWILVGLAMVVGLPIGLSQLQWKGGWLGALGLVPLVGGLIAWQLTRRQQIRQVPAVLLFGSWAFVLVLFSVGTTAIDQNRETGRLWERVAGARTDRTRLATYRCLESSWVYYAQQPIWELTPASFLAPEPSTDSVNAKSLVVSSHPGDRSSRWVVTANYQTVDRQEDSMVQVRSTETEGVSRQSDGEAGGLKPDPLAKKRAWHAKPRPTPLQLTSAYPDSFIVVPAEHLEELLAQLPPGFHEWDRCRRFLKKGELVLVGPPVHH